MPRKKEEWVRGREATAILSANSGRPIADSYLRLLAVKGKITSRPIDGRTNEYLKSDVEAYQVRKHTRPAVKPAA